MPFNLRIYALHGMIVVFAEKDVDCEGPPLVYLGTEASHTEGFDGMTTLQQEVILDKYTEVSYIADAHPDLGAALPRQAPLRQPYIPRQGVGDLLSRAEAPHTVGDAFAFCADLRAGQLRSSHPLRIFNFAVEEGA
ncbi:hypothetical protein T492DRAFT_846284 [Pavlovales sp. CCMP2436]|nr:hypothetical protein T492DRAFT_846284 [Pavlovales sp. CCMP2436]